MNKMDKWDYWLKGEKEDLQDQFWEGEYFSITKTTKSSTTGL